MDVTLLYFEGCPHWRMAEERIRAALVALGREDQHVAHVLVHTPQDAARLDFIGSPTIRVNGRDPFSHDDQHPALACRLFSTPNGQDGAPTIGQLIQVLS